MPSGAPDAPPAARTELPQSDSEAISVGAFLRTERRRRGIILEALAVQTGIPLRSLERLEQGAFDVCGDGMARSFARAVAEALGVDPDDTVARFGNVLPFDRSGLSRGRLLREALLWSVFLSVMVGGLVWLANGIMAGEASAPPGGWPREVVVRRDAVRALAAERGLLAPSSPASEPPLAALDSIEVKPPLLPSESDPAQN